MNVLENPAESDVLAESPLKRMSTEVSSTVEYGNEENSENRPVENGQVIEPNHKKLKVEPEKMLFESREDSETACPPAEVNDAAEAALTEIRNLPSECTTPNSKPRRPEPSLSSTNALAQKVPPKQQPKEANKKYFTPLRVKPKVRKEDVQATNDGYASVAKLSAWLADDPTSTKKLRHVRKGRNVIQKSRKFEKDLEDVIVEELQITRGAVSDKKKWLDHAFKKNATDDDDEFASLNRAGLVSRYAQTEIGINYDNLGMSSLTSRRSSVGDARSEIIERDDASCLSVSDKKEWLKTAFVKKTPTKKYGNVSKARSDILAQRGPSRDEMAARAKSRFRERSARKLNQKVETVDSVDSVSVCSGSVTEASTCSGSTPSLMERRVEEDKTPVDFRAARNLLVERSKANGNAVHVMSKVQRRKEKFEKLEKEARRRSGAHGLLKPTWDHANPNCGQASDSYTKTYVEDIAPKKSFEELP